MPLPLPPVIHLAEELQSLSSVRLLTITKNNRTFPFPSRNTKVVKRLRERGGGWRDWPQSRAREQKKHSHPRGKKYVPNNGASWSVGRRLDGGSRKYRKGLATFQLFYLHPGFCSMYLTYLNVFPPPPSANQRGKIKFQEVYSEIYAHVVPNPMISKGSTCD